MTTCDCNMWVKRQKHNIFQEHLSLKLQLYFHHIQHLPVSRMVSRTLVYAFSLWPDNIVIVQCEVSQRNKLYKEVYKIHLCIQRTESETAYLEDSVEETHNTQHFWRVRERRTHSRLPSPFPSPSLPRSLLLSSFCTGSQGMTKLQLRNLLLFQAGLTLITNGER